MQRTTELAKKSEKAAIVAINPSVMKFAEEIAADFFSMKPKLNYISVQDGFGQIANFRRQ